MQKVKKGIDNCLSCAKTSNTTWYIWRDTIIQKGRIVSERICLKCAKAIVGSRYLNELE